MFCRFFSPPLSRRLGESEREGDRPLPLYCAPKVPPGPGVLTHRRVGADAADCDRLETGGLWPGDGTGRTGGRRSRGRHTRTRQDINLLPNAGGSPGGGAERSVAIAAAAAGEPSETR